MTPISSQFVISLKETVDTHNAQLGQSRWVDTHNAQLGQLRSDCIWARFIASEDFGLFKESLRYILSVQEPPKFLLNLKWKLLSFVCSFDMTHHVKDEPLNVRQFVNLGHECSEFGISPYISATGLRCIRIYADVNHMNESPAPSLPSTAQRLEFAIGVEQARLERITELYGPRN